MKKIIFLITFMIMFTGCDITNNNDEVTDTECLNNAYVEVEKYFNNNNENFVFYGLGEDKVIIGLIDVDTESAKDLKLKLDDYLSCIEIIKTDPNNTHINND